MSLLTSVYDIIIILSILERPFGFHIIDSDRTESPRSRPMFQNTLATPHNKVIVFL